MRLRPIPARESPTITKLNISTHGILRGASGFSFFFFCFNFYLFMRDTERKREREREGEGETQAEGEAGSMQGAQCGTPSQVSRTTPWAEGGAKQLSHPGCPLNRF